MGLFRRLFRDRDAPPKHAVNLVEVAEINALSLIMPLSDEFPTLKNVPLEVWDFFVTVAGVFVATTRLYNAGFSERKVSATLAVIERSLEAWKPDALRAFADCKQLFERQYDQLAATGHDPTFVAADALGFWIVANVFGRLPKDAAEMRIGRAAGSMVIHAFHSHWRGA